MVPALVMFVASVLFTVLMAPKPTVPVAASLRDFDVPQTEEGTPLTVFFGTCHTNSWTVLAMGNFRTSQIKSGSAKK